MATEEEKRLAAVKRLQEALEDLSDQASKTTADLEAVLAAKPIGAVDSFKAVAKAIQTQTAAYRTSEENLKKLAKAEQEAADARQKAFEVHGYSSEQYSAAQKSLIDIQERQTKATADQANIQAELEKVIGKNTRAQKIYADIQKDLADGQQVTNEQFAKAATLLEKYEEKMGMGSAMADSLQDSFLGLSGGLGQVAALVAGGPAAIDGFGSGVMGMESIVSLTSGTMLKLVEVSFDFALEQDKVFSEFRKSTGAGREFDGVMKDIEGSGRIAGVTLAEAAEAVGALKNTFTDFTYYNKETQKEIGKTVTTLAEIGFGMQTQAQIIQTTTQSMGMSIEGAQDFLLDIQNTATSLGIDVDRLGQEFEKNRDILARYGGNATEVFKEMAVQAKAVGMEVSQLLGVVDKFKKFDDAAQAVGRLNAIMGKPALNAMDMLNAAYEDPAAGVRMIKDAFDEAGNSVEALSGQELMVWADALGMSAAEAANFLGQSNEELQINQMEMEEAAQKAQEMQSITDQLSNAFKQLYLDAEPFLTNVLIPIVKGFADFMEIIGKGIRGLGTFGSTAIFVGTALAGIAMLIPGLQGLSFASLAILATAGGVAAGAMASYGENNSEEGVAAAQEIAGFSSMAKGGRIFASMIPAPLKRFSNGGVVLKTSAGSPSVPIRMNEANRKELAIVPTGTMIANADDTKKVIQSNEAVLGELKGLRRDMLVAAENKAKEKVQLVLDNGREFTTTVVRDGLNAGNSLSPFGGGRS